MSILSSSSRDTRCGPPTAAGCESSTVKRLAITRSRNRFATRSQPIAMDLISFTHNQGARREVTPQDLKIDELACVTGVQLIKQRALVRIGTPSPLRVAGCGVSPARYWRATIFTIVPTPEKIMA